MSTAELAVSGLLELSTSSSEACPQHAPGWEDPVVLQAQSRKLMQTRACIPQLIFYEQEEKASDKMFLLEGQGTQGEKEIMWKS